MGWHWSQANAWIHVHTVSTSYYVLYYYVNMFGLVNGIFPHMVLFLSSCTNVHMYDVVVLEQGSISIRRLADWLIGITPLAYTNMHNVSPCSGFRIQG